MLDLGRIMTVHPNAVILRGMADGRQVVARYAPQDANYMPLQDAPSTALQELIRPGTLANPGRWEFSFADALEAV